MRGLFDSRGAPPRAGGHGAQDMVPLPAVKSPAGVLGLIVAGFVFASIVVLTPSGAIGGAMRSSGTLQLNGSLPMRYMLGVCPPGTPGNVGCWEVEGAGVVPGLGRTTLRFTFYDEEHPVDSCSIGSTPHAVFTVAGKGEIDLAAAARSCSQATSAMSFTVTAGSGVYAGGTGSGTLTAQFGGLGARTGGVGRITWSGALTVPGLEFDVTPPVLSGAANKSVLVRGTARRARVRFSVTARDAVDGGVATTCKPRSGSWFRLGKTSVRCAATDTSGNTATAAFFVRVRRRS